MRSTRDTRTQVTLLALACAMALALSACGSGAQSHGSNADPGLEFAKCMRSHGVPNFSDPSPGGGGIQIPSGSGINPASPAFQSAQKACSRLMPGGGPANAKSSESRKLQLVKLAECMRRHGLTTFPDPTSGPPSPPPSGGGIAFGSPGAFISVPQSLIESPGFKQAAAACGFLGAGKPPGH